MIVAYPNLELSGFVNLGMAKRIWSVKALANLFKIFHLLCRFKTF